MVTRGNEVITRLAKQPIFTCTYMYCIVCMCVHEQEKKEIEQAAMLLESASNYYHESGHGDTAGQVLTKAAKLVDSVNPLRAVDYHLATADLHLTEDKHRDAANATRRAVNMAARAKE